jgi:hypothetical protein
MIGCRFTNDNIMYTPSLAAPPLLRRSVYLPCWQVGGRVAIPGLEGGQVAVLRLHAATTGHVTMAAYSCLRGVYVRQGTKCLRALRSATNFGEHDTYELRTTPTLKRAPHPSPLRWRLTCSARRESSGRASLHSTSGRASLERISPARLVPRARLRRDLLS